MRGLLYSLSIAVVVLLAFWAYGEGYETRATQRAVSDLRVQIGARHQELSMLRAEWAYLNRPDRLHELAEMNFERLGLMPLTPDHFAQADQVAYPPQRPPEWPVWAGGPALEEKIDGVIIMSHNLQADPEPVIVAPPTLARDGEQLP
ncbi:MAG: hypothetical protein AAF919_18210 [Pseudomonadota bacterium]